MIRTLISPNPYAEIMSRYRPIAPKPNHNHVDDDGNDKSTYLRNVWAHTRTSFKRARPASFDSLPPIINCFQPPFLLNYLQCTNSTGVAMHSTESEGSPLLTPVKCSLNAAVTTLAETVALPFVYRATEEINFNIKPDHGPQEVDFLPQLQSPVKPCIISPRPVRPVGSSIMVKNIITGEPSQRTMAARAEEVVEAEEVPAIVSDSNNKVRMSNAAYKKMVGQPECGWLDCAGGEGGVCRRIGGEVSIGFADLEPRLLDGFCCRVKIEWEGEGERKCVEASCEVVKLACENYRLWRLHITED